MAYSTARSSTDFADFRVRYRDRLDALARVQGLLSRLNDHDRVTFDELVATEISAMGGAAEKVVTKGPVGVRLRSSTVQTLAMAIHELATNAQKYGALAQPAARLEITWSVEDAGSSKPLLHIDWRESGVVMPEPGGKPAGSGQGRSLIEEALPYQMQAQTTYVLGQDGVHCTITIPILETAALRKEAIHA
jgi:two-component sensor histidine kinase